MSTVLALIGPAIVCALFTAASYRSGYRTGFRAGYRAAMMGIQAARASAEALHALRRLGFRVGEPSEDE